MILLAGRLPKRLGILAKPNEPRAVLVATQIAEWAAARGIKLLVDRRVGQTPPGTTVLSEQEIASESDVIIVLGGDGTMIAAARLVFARGTPVIGINLGSLGYLTECSVNNFLPALDSVAEADYETDQRTMLDWRVVRSADEIARGAVLNDVVLNKSALARIIEIDCAIGGEQLTVYRAD